MSRLPGPGIFSNDEYRRLKEAGVSIFNISSWHRLRVTPHSKRKVQIAGLLGRDPWAKDSKPAEAPPPVAQSPPTVPRPRIEINPCIDDGVCLAVRKAAMRPIANTLIDQRREIPCTNCKQGVARAKAEAAKKRASAGRVGDTYACGESKSYGSVSCQECRDEKRGARNASM